MQESLSCQYPLPVTDTVQTVALFVDVQNIYYTTLEGFGCHFDYNAFWAEATADRTVIKAIAFATHRDDEKQKQFQNILRGIGFEVKLKPFLQRRDGSAKADWDVGITLEVLEYAALTEVVVLASGDRGFRYAGGEGQEQASDLRGSLRGRSIHGRFADPGSFKVCADRGANAAAEEGIKGEATLTT